MKPVKTIKPILAISVASIIVLIMFVREAKSFYSRCEKDPKACESKESKAQQKDFSKTEWANWTPPEKSDAAVKAWEEFKKKYPTANVTWNVNTGFPSMISNFQTEPYSGAPNKIAEIFINELQTLLGIDMAELQMSETRVMADYGQSGILVKYQQIYKGVSIEDSSVELSISEKGAVDSIKLNYYPDIRVKNVTPIITSDDAVNIIKQDLDTLEAPIKAPEISLVFDRPTETPPALFLAWKIKIEFPEMAQQTANSSKAWLYYIDAHTGEVLHVWDSKIY